MKNQVTAEQIQAYCKVNKVELSFSPNGLIRHMEMPQGMLIAMVDTSKLATMVRGDGEPDNGFAVTLDAPGYYALAAVLERAFKQASEGKGQERHGNGVPFEQQPMQTIARAHGVGFLTGQASKKAEEAHGLAHDAKIAEWLGAINYLAGAIIFEESKRAAKPAEPELTVGTYTEIKAAAIKSGKCLAPDTERLCAACRASGSSCMTVVGIVSDDPLSKRIKVRRPPSSGAAAVAAAADRAGEVHSNDNTGGWSKHG